MRRTCLPVVLFDTPVAAAVASVALPWAEDEPPEAPTTAAEPVAASAPAAADSESSESNSSDALLTR